jgi:hypothetical protein
MTSFWKWLFQGTGAGAGLRRFVDVWLLLHAGVAVGAAVLLPITLKAAAVELLLPLAGIFIGLSFAWGGNAQALLQTTEVEAVSKFTEGGYEDYVYAFQASILLILTTLVLWSVAGLGMFDLVWPKDRTSIAYMIVSATMFFFLSITLRECWHVVLGAQSMLLMRYKIRQRKKSE